MKHLSRLISDFPLFNDTEAAHKNANGRPAKGTQRLPMGFQSHRKGQSCGNSRQRMWCEGCACRIESEEERDEHMWTKHVGGKLRHEYIKKTKQKYVDVIVKSKQPLLISTQHIADLLTTFFFFSRMTRTKDFEGRWDVFSHNHIPQTPPVANAYTHLDQQKAAFWGGTIQAKQKEECTSFKVTWSKI